MEYRYQEFDYCCDGASLIVNDKGDVMLRLLLRYEDNKYVEIFCQRIMPVIIHKERLQFDPRIRIWGEGFVCIQESTDATIV